MEPMQSTFEEVELESVNEGNNCLQYCYDKNTKECCGRTGIQWGKLLLYYLVFCLILIVLFAFALMVILLVLDSHGKPVYYVREVGSESSDGGLSIFPMHSLKAPLIWFRTSDANQVSFYTDYIQKRLSAYNEEGVDICSETSGSKITNKRRKRNIKISKSSQKSCKFDTSSLGSCGTSPYGYKDGAPCIYLKINKMLDWNPKPYTNSSNLPSDMPAKLQKLIHSGVEKLWINCEGYNIWDKENMQEIEYFPNQGIDPVYFPYTADKNYQSPLVAIKISSTKYKGMLLTISCQLWIQGDFTIETIIQTYVRDK